MTETFRRVSLSVDEPEPISIPAPRGINKGHLMVCLAFGAAILSVTSTIFGLYKWRQGEEALARASTVKAEAETAKLQVDRRISDVDAKYADRFRLLEMLLTQRDAELRVQQIQTEKTAQRKNVEEADLASKRAVVEQVNGVFQTQVALPLVPILKRAAMCATARDGEDCGMGNLISPRSVVSTRYPPAYAGQLPGSSKNPLNNPYLESDAPYDPYARRASLPDNPYSARGSGNLPSGPR